MATELFTHPSPEQLRGFAQGRLSTAEMTELEQHIAHCDSCCLHLEQVPDDTLVQLAREAATQGIRTPATTRAEPVPKQSAVEIPKELRDHPRYRVLSLLATGGMGAVYKAEHRLMERLVALKVINPGLLANPQALERFRREVRAAARLSHPNIVAAHDADQAGELHFLIMEFVDGLNLERWLAHKGPLAPAQAANLIRQAALGLEHMHEKGMVHRDIKPLNLMVTLQGNVKVLDCGLARLAGEPGTDHSSGAASTGDKPGMTTAGMILGTPDYIAPEQVTDPRRADIRADIYALGCTLFYALTGQPPFPTGTMVEKLNQHLKSAPPSILARRPDVPAELARVLEKMLAKDPAQRYQTPGEVAKDLLPLTKGQGRAGGQAFRQPDRTPAPLEAATIVTSAPADALVPLPNPLEVSLGASPLDDPTLGDTLAISPSPLRRIVQPTRRSNLPFRLTPPVAVAIAIGGVVLIALLAWGINSALSTGDNSQQTAAYAGPAAATPPNSPIASTTPPKSAAARSTAAVPATPSSVASGAIGSNLPRKVLLVIPSYDLYGPDYWGVVNACQKSGVMVDIASTTLDPPKLLNQASPPNFHADRLVSSVKGSADYGAIIFAGFATAEFEPGGAAGRDTARLIQDFQKNGRIVASICAGQRALDRNRLLADRPVATCPALKNNGESIAGVWKDEQVVEDGQFITAGTADDALEFIRHIAAHLANAF
jgi:serine/threonine protein kinase/putative intracellular protease/amidase